MIRIACQLLALLLLLSLAVRAQPSPPAPAPAPPGQPWGGIWGGGFGVGNGLELHAGYFANNHWLLLGRARYKWWGPTSGPGSGAQFLVSSLNTRSRQAEGAVLAGYDLTKGHNRAYAAAGLGYVAGRKLGEYRYTIHGNSVIEQTHYYAYTQYQALSLPLEIGAMHSFPRARLALGLSLQANLNPDQSQYCLLFSMWFGKRGLAHLAP